MMKNFFMTTIFLTSILGCKKNSYYNSDLINILSISIEKDFKLIEYTVPLETLFFSSGCEAAYSQDSTKVTLKFIRQKINTPFYGNLKSNLIHNDIKISYILRLPKNVLRVTILYPQRAIVI